MREKRGRFLSLVTISYLQFSYQD